MKRRPKLIIHRQRAGEYRWRLISTSGKVIADSGEGYLTLQGARRAAVRLKPNADAAELAY